MDVNSRNQGVFTRFAHTISQWTGSATAFCGAVLVIAVWSITGPIFHYSDTWQLVINTGTTIITFLMVFLIQNTQNRDSAAMQLKLDELLRATEGAHLSLLDLEELDEDELKHIRKMYQELAAYGRKRLDQGKADTNQPDLDKKELLNTSQAYQKSHMPLHERLAE